MFPKKTLVSSTDNPLKGKIFSHRCHIDIIHPEKPVAIAPESQYLFEVLPVEVGEGVPFSGEGQNGVGPQPHLSIHTWSEVNTQEWKLGIWDLEYEERVDSSFW